MSGRDDFLAWVKTTLYEAERESPPPERDPSETLRELTELRRRGVVTDAEFETLRAQLPV